MLINKSVVKRAILETGSQFGKNKERTRVSNGALILIDEMVLDLIRKYTMNHPEGGKTYNYYRNEDFG